MALPADPESMNDERSEWADEALEAFKALTGADEDTAITDLLCDLMHWADRNSAEPFEAALDRAKTHYDEETGAEMLECQWFLNCTREAVTAVPHPILGDVPICKRCADKMQDIDAQTRSN